MQKTIISIVIIISVLANIILAVSLIRSNDLTKYYQNTLNETRIKTKENVQFGKKVIYQAKQNEKNLNEALEKEKEDTANLQPSIKEKNITHKPNFPEYEQDKLPELQKIDPTINDKVATSKLKQIVELMRIIDNTSTDLTTKKRLKVFEEMNHTVMVNLSQFLNTGDVIALDTLVKELRLLTKMYVNV